MGRRLLAWALVSGCSLFPSLDGLTGDAGSDASGFDADAAPSDAAQDSGPSFCAHLSPTPQFCDDFDTQPLDASWSLENLSFATATLDPTHVVSTPLACLLATQPVEAGAAAVIAHTMTLPIGNSTFAFDIYIDEADPQIADDVELASIDLPPYAIFLKHDPGAPATILLEQIPTDAGLTYNPIALSRAIQQGNWYRIEIDIVGADGGVGTFAVQMGPADGPLVVVTPPFNPSYPAQGVPTITLRTGFYDIPSNAWRVYFDNVVFDTAP